MASHRPISPLQRHRRAAHMLSEAEKDVESGIKRHLHPWNIAVLEGKRDEWAAELAAALQHLRELIHHERHQRDRTHGGHPETD